MAVPSVWPVVEVTERAGGYIVTSYGGQTKRTECPTIEAALEAVRTALAAGVAAMARPGQLQT